MSSSSQHESASASSDAADFLDNRWADDLPLTHEQALGLLNKRESVVGVSNKTLEKLRETFNRVKLYGGQYGKDHTEEESDDSRFRVLVFCATTKGYGTHVIRRSMKRRDLGKALGASDHQTISCRFISPHYAVLYASNDDRDERDTRKVNAFGEFGIGLHWRTKHIRGNVALVRIVQKRLHSLPLRARTPPPKHMQVMALLDVLDFPGLEQEVARLKALDDASGATSTSAVATAPVSTAVAALPTTVAGVASRPVLQADQPDAIEVITLDKPRQHNQSLSVTRPSDDVVELMSRFADPRVQVAVANLIGGDRREYEYSIDADGGLALSTSLRGLEDILNEAESGYESG